MPTHEQLSREEAAVREIGHTDFQLGTSGFLAVCLLLTVFSFWVFEGMFSKSAQGGAEGAGLQLANLAASGPRAVRAFLKTDSSFLKRSLAATDSLHSDIKSFESALQDSSFATKTLLPPIQSALTRWLGAGNEKAYVGKDHWLYYRPDIDLLTGRGFLEHRQLRRRTLSGDRWTPAPQPDPLKAILHFRDQLARRGIELLVVPVPPKPMIDPEHFAPGFNSAGRALSNPSLADFFASLKEARVRVFDGTDLLRERKHGAGGAQYLETDTHWTPAAMEAFANRLAGMIVESKVLSPQGSAEFRSESVSVANLGDIAVMLQLPKDQQLYREQEVQTRLVMNAQNELWRPDRTSELLVLGDSFSNIYSLSAMGWGESAGLVEQLSLQLGRPVDCLLRNDSGAFATREMLAHELARGRDRLAGKKLVVWEFAMRELAFGDWKLIPMDLKAAPDRRMLIPPAGEEWTVRGSIQSISSSPRPGHVLYKDHILSLHLVDIDQAGRAEQGGEAVVYLWSMRDNQLTAAAHFRVGQTITLRLRPWADVSGTLDRINRSELPDEQLQLEEPCWGEVIAR